MDCKVGFIGFGLIAGSIAHSLKESGSNYTIIATSRRLEPVYEAKKDGVVDEVLDSIDNRLSDCDFIILCTPVITMNDYLKQLKSIVKKSCIITDVGMSKLQYITLLKSLIWKMFLLVVILWWFRAHRLCQLIFRNNEKCPLCYHTNIKNY